MRQRAGPPQNPPVEKRQADESRASVYPAVVQERIDGGQRGRGHPLAAQQHDDELRADRERPEFRERERERERKREREREERERERSHGSTANFSVFHSRVVREDEGGTSSSSAIRAVILCERTSKASRRGRPPAFERERERERERGYLRLCPAHVLCTTRTDKTAGRLFFSCTHDEGYPNQGV